MKSPDRRHRVYVSLIAIVLITVPIISSGWNAPAKQILPLDRVTVVHKNRINPTLNELAGGRAQAERNDDMISDTEPVIHRSGPAPTLRVCKALPILA
jgi:hypothetical protein